MSEVRVTRAGARPPLRILIVDDNQDAADSLAVVLELCAPAPGSPTFQSRYDVRVAYDGAAALRAAREFLPDCLVSDIRMPGLDGYRLARAVRGEPALAGVKLVALSSFADAEHVRRAAEAGFDYQLTKANHVPELLEVLGMIEEIKNLAARTRELAEKNVGLAGQTKELLQEVKADVRELKQDVAELKQEIKELKDEQKDGPADGAPPK
jgi:two-component system OmpR family response regulator